jgi:hypothetical protein
MTIPATKSPVMPHKVVKACDSRLEIPPSRVAVSSIPVMKAGPAMTTVRNA